MRSPGILIAALAIATFVAATPPDSAVIVNSGSTNAYGYKIEVSSDGRGTSNLQNRDGSAASTPKPFTLPAATASRFFADLAAARKETAVTVACMKSVSFGSTMRVTWQDWTSSDLTCPAKDSIGEALIKDVDEIRQASGIPESLLRSSP
ncbi:MAG TPA: hypothetical protein VMU38_11255 [Candidatus Binatia bacterium]|nr:hypothetical protein [Candidatus Binatia bacterium]